MHEANGLISRKEILKEADVKSKMSEVGLWNDVAVLCVTSADTLALLLSHDVVVEISPQKHVRIFHMEGVSATICQGGRMAAVHHPAVEIVQHETQVLFDVIQGIRVRATSSTVRVLDAMGTNSTNTAHSIKTQKVRTFDDHSEISEKIRLRRDMDTTAALFLQDGLGGDMLGIFDNKRARCLLAAQQAICDQKEAQFAVVIQGVKVKHNVLTGDTRIYCGRNFISLSVRTHALTLHSPWVDINVDRTGKTRLRRGDQIIEANAQRLIVRQNDKQAEFDLNTVEDYKKPVKADLY